MSFKRWMLLRFIVLGPCFAFFVLLALFSLGHAFLLSKGMMSGHSAIGGLPYVLRFEARMGKYLGILIIPVVVFEIVSASLMKRRKTYEGSLSVTDVTDLKTSWPPTPILPR